MSANAPFGHRAGLREDGIVRYLGWAVPEAGLWTTVVDLVPITDELIATVREHVSLTYVPWSEDDT